MYGVPADLDLSKFLGAELTQLCFGQFIQIFHFDSKASISVECSWELRDSQEELIDRVERGTPCENGLHAHLLLGKKVVECRLDTPASISLRFESGPTLIIFDDSYQYDSFSIQPGNIIV
jgi:hypothetical protein